MAVRVTEPPQALFVPVILGTVRKERMSLPVARLMTAELSRRPGIETELIDIAQLPLPVDDAGRAISDAAFAARMSRADALVIVSPEYNHGYSGLLKHVLDSCLGSTSTRRPASSACRRARGEERVASRTCCPCCASSGW